MWTIYALLDPDTRNIHYIGYTFGSVSERLRRHVSDSQRMHYRKQGLNKKARWIRGLLKEERRPEVVVLQTGETGSGRSHVNAEQLWIALFRAAGMELVNTSPGRPKGKGE